MENYILVKNDELYHHGILGQKWGVRRFQNKDGSLTAVGRKKYTKFDSEGYKYDRKRELENEGVTGLKNTMLVNNEAHLLKIADRRTYNSMIKQEKLTQKLKDASESHDSKQFNKLLNEWMSYQTNIRLDEIMQNKDKFEPYAKEFVKTALAHRSFGIIGALIAGKEFFKLDSEYLADAKYQAEKDAEEYKKQFK